MPGAMSPPPLLEREAAIATVRAAVAAGRPLLLHGPAGVGKSAVLRAALAAPAAAPRRPLFCSGANPAAMYRQALAAVRGGEDTRPLRGDRCRYLLRAELAARPCCLVWDPAPVVPRAAANALRELLRSGSTPLIAAARSPHMEDTGALALFFALQSERLAVRPLSEAAALRLAEAECERLQLRFPHPARALEELLQLAQGNPGEILAMLAMARQPRYRYAGAVDGEPKLRLIYVDRLTGARRVPAETPHAG
jgi:hypothetical protein